MQIRIPAARAALFLACLAAAACGPRDIGDGSSRDGEVPHTPAPAVDAMRMPMTGEGAIPQMLYDFNRPEVMDYRIKRNQMGLRQETGTAVSPEDPAYRATPRQRSPFRQ